MTDGNTPEGFAAHGLMQAETVLVNAAEVLALVAAAQVFAWVAVLDAAAGAATSAERFPTILLHILPLVVSCLLGSHRTQNYSICDLTFGPLTYCTISMNSLSMR